VTDTLAPGLHRESLTREAWLRERGSFVGASEIASILGLPGAYSTIGGVWVSKINAKECAEAERQSAEAMEEASNIDPETAEKLNHQSIGLIVEPAILTMYELRNPSFTVRRNGLQIWRHPEYPFIGATLDAEAETEFKDKRTVEAKNVSIFKRQEWGAEGSDETPAIFAAQGVQQMLVREHLGYGTFCDYPVLFGGNDFKIFSVPYDAKLAQQIIDVLSWFWNLVETRTPPPIDYSGRGAAKLMRQIYSKIVGETLTLQQGTATHDRALDLIYTRDYADNEAKLWTARKDEAHAELLSIAGNNARVEIPVVVDGKTKIIAMNRKEQRGYDVPARFQEPMIKTTFEPFHLKKRREIFDALPERKMTRHLSDGAKLIEGETENE